MPKKSLYRNFALLHHSSTFLTKEFKMDGILVRSNGSLIFFGDYNNNSTAVVLGRMFVIKNPVNRDEAQRIADLYTSQLKERDIHCTKSRNYAWIVDTADDFIQAMLQSAGITGEAEAKAPTPEEKKDQE